jgi:hypothetical protein
MVEIDRSFVPSAVTCRSTSRAKVDLTTFPLSRKPGKLPNVVIWAIKARRQTLPIFPAAV